MAKGFGSKGGMKSFSKGGGSSRSYASRSSFGGSRNSGSGSRFSFGSGGGGSRRSWFSAPGSPGHRGGSSGRSIWDDTGPEVMREEGTGAPLDVAGLVDGVEEAVDAYRERDWGRFWRVVGFAILAVVVVLVMLSG